LTRGDARKFLNQLDAVASDAARRENFVRERGERAAVERIAANRFAPVNREARRAPVEFLPEPARSGKRAVAVELGIIRRRNPFAGDFAAQRAVMRNLRRMPVFPMFKNVFFSRSIRTFLPNR